MKYVCKRCGDPCFIEFEDDCEFTPTHCPFDGELDAVWRKLEKKAMPKLTAEDSKPQLPDWLKLGAWAAVGKFVGKIDWINRDASECRITCGESRFAKTAEVKAVTWRAWSDDEMRKQVGTILKGKRWGHFVLVTECGFRPDASRSYLFLGAGSTGRNADEILENCEQLSGLPCGVPQVDGADLEG